MIDGDGADLFNTAHSNGPSGGTYSNRLAIDADLTEASLEDALAIAQTMTDARGLPAALQVQRLVVAAGTNSFNAQRILGSVLQNDTGNNATNAVRDMNSVRDGWLSYTRRALEFGQDNAFASENARFKATMRYVFGWTDARGAIGSQGN